MGCNPAWSVRESETRVRSASVIAIQTGRHLAGESEDSRQPSGRDFTRGSHFARSLNMPRRMTPPLTDSSQQECPFAEGSGRGPKRSVQTIT